MSFIPSSDLAEAPSLHEFCQAIPAYLPDGALPGQFVPVRSPIQQ